MIYINSITICPKNITITKGKWYYNTCVEVCPVNATCKCLAWHSSNPSVASVNQSGYICGVSQGVAVIYATAQDGSGVAGFCNVTVEAPVLVSSVTVTPTSKTINVGDTLTLAATVCPNNAIDKRIRWTSSDTTVAEVGYTSGKVTAMKEGLVHIQANTVDGSGIYGDCVLTVKNVLVDSITIEPQSVAMAVGLAKTLTATVFPSNVTNKTILWSSSNENVATVDPSTGYVVARSPGLTNITASSQDGSNRYANCSVAVNELFDNDNRSWKEMGFAYDGSLLDSIRLAQGMPPSSYEQWVLNGSQKAIYISDTGVLPVVGHALLLIRGSAGIWYKTQFSGPFDDKSAATITCVSQNESEIEELLNRSGVKYVYLYGYYQSSLEKALYYSNNNDNSYNGKYNLVDNNCLHYVKEILRSGYHINNIVNNFIFSSLIIVPEEFYTSLNYVLDGGWTV